MTFDEYFAKLKENSIWWDQLPLSYPNRNLTAVARQHYTWMVAMEMKFEDWKHIRVVYQKFLWQAGESHEQPKYDKAEPIQIAENVLKRETPEYLAAAQKVIDAIQSAPMWKKPVPVLDAEIEGAERKKEHGIFHPSTSEEDILRHERHLLYIRQNYDAVTGAKLPVWISEEEFNKTFIQTATD